MSTTKQTQTNQTEIETEPILPSAEIGNDGPAYDSEYWYALHRKTDTKIMENIREKNGTKVKNGIVCVKND
jgi:hypothetical protein